MAIYTATVSWNRKAQEPFTDNHYSREHLWQFDGGARIPASASPHIVPLPLSIEQNIDPEEAFVAAISSCHMLFFLSLAAKKGWLLNSYEDKATGEMARNSAGKTAITQVKLQPKLTFAHEPPSIKAQQALHHQAHQQCFIANSVNTQITIEV